MPHIKVEPFDTNLIDSSIGFVEFVAKSNGVDIALVVHNGVRLFLDIVKREREYLIKPNGVTKVSDTHILKEILNRFAKEFNLKVLSSNTNIKPYKPKSAHWALKSIEDFYDFKSSYKNIKLELGFGSARHLLYRAKQERDTLFIGIEIHTPSINQLLKQINLQSIENIIVVNYDARLLLEMLPSNILDIIYVHFPVPWDKKPHRRVISRYFLDESLRVLKKGGFLELRSDSQNYYEYSLDIFSQPKVCSFSVKKNIDIDIISKYEERWRGMNKDIYTLRVDSLEISEDRVLDIDFEFDINSIDDLEFPSKSIVKDDYFVHFGKSFKYSRGFVVEVSFGSFGMPEKKMIVCDGSQCYYLPSNPVKSLVNKKAHNLIKEVLNG